MAEFVDFIKDYLKKFGTPTSKKMFGGYGIYLNAKIIGIIYDGEFYIKAKLEVVEEYKKQGLKQFCYEKNGKFFYMKYFVLEDEMLENADILKKYIQDAN